MKKRVLFLGYGPNETKLISALINANCELDHTKDKIEAVDYDLIISFGYRHILNKHFLEHTACPVINLHISYLPYNKGAHPNFWSFYDKTPSGVTIHLVDEGIDTGPILYQKQIDFGPAEVTFSQTHQRLIHEIEQLFLDNLENILNSSWVAKPQQDKGTLHYAKDLPKAFSNWDANIVDEIQRLKHIAKHGRE